MFEGLLVVLFQIINPLAPHQSCVLATSLPVVSSDRSDASPHAAVGSNRFDVQTAKRRNLKQSQEKKVSEIHDTTHLH